MVLRVLLCVCVYMCVCMYVSACHKAPEEIVGMKIGHIQCSRLRKKKTERERSRQTDRAGERK